MNNPGRRIDRWADEGGEEVQKTSGQAGRLIQKELGCSAHRMDTVLGGVRLWMGGWGG